MRTSFGIASANEKKIPGPLTVGFSWPLKEKKEKRLELSGETLKNSNVPLFISEKYLPR
jgi:hypothetical protein